MKIYLDTSILLKLYHRENDSDEIERLLHSGKLDTIYLSEISKVEFCSAIFKKVRTKEIDLQNALITLNLFESDFSKYTFIPSDSLIVEQAKLLVMQYSEAGLRTLDAIQFSTAVYLKGKASHFFTSDKLLHSFFLKENLYNSNI